MATPQRLPLVNNDDGVWGDIIRQYVMKEHYNDDTDNSANGGHQKITIRPGTTAAGTAPLKFTAGSLLATPEAGAVEFYADDLYVTTSTPTRMTIAAYNDAAGAAGDLYYRDSGGNFVRLPVGSTSQVLTVTGGLPAWQSGSSASKSIIHNVGGGSTITAGNAAGTDYVYHIDNNLQLPNCTASTNSYKVRNVGSTVINVLPNGVQTIAEATSFPIRPFDSWEFISDTISNWGTF